jgi:UDPglucose 6-dehydrogenase
MMRLALVRFVLNECEREMPPLQRDGGRRRRRLADVQRVSVIGLGKLGLCLAVVLADSGFEVIGIDVDQEKVKSIAGGHSPIYEHGLDALLDTTKGAFSVTTEYGAAIRQSEATFVVVPTPSKKTGEFSLRYVKVAMERLGEVMATKAGYHLVVLNSTVMPGSMDGLVIPTLERTSRKKSGKDFGVCYNPEFIALGDVLRGLRNPDFVLVGESDSKAGELLARIQRRVCANAAPIERMSFLNAELAKIAVNSFVTMKMSFANTLAEICERMPGGDVDQVTQAIGRDKRIGTAYLKGGIGYGGPCFPRDNVAFAAFAKNIGVKAELALASDRTNNRQVLRIIKLIENRFTPSSVSIGVLGITYKPNTDIVESSQPLMVARGLARKGFEVHVYDPALTRDNINAPSDLNVEDDADTCLEKSDVCVIATPWNSFSKIDKSKFSKKVVLDCWRILNGNRPDDPSNYLALGQDMSSKKVILA